MKKNNRMSERLFVEEMAYAGIVEGLRIEVRTDHNPPHFHVIKKDDYEARVDINTNEVIGYKWQRKDKKIITRELKAINSWLDRPSEINHRITNREKIMLLWDALNHDMREME